MPPILYERALLHPTLEKSKVWAMPACRAQQVARRADAAARRARPLRPRPAPRPPPPAGSGPPPPRAARPPHPALPPPTQGQAKAHEHNCSVPVCAPACHGSWRLWSQPNSACHMDYLLAGGQRAAQCLHELSLAAAVGSAPGDVLIHQRTQIYAETWPGDLGAQPVAL